MNVKGGTVRIFRGYALGAAVPEAGVKETGKG